jgi:hypothetical protein
MGLWWRLAGSSWVLPQVLKSVETATALCICGLRTTGSGWQQQHHADCIFTAVQNGRPGAHRLVVQRSGLVDGQLGSVFLAVIEVWKRCLVKAGPVLWQCVVSADASEHAATLRAGCSSRLVINSAPVQMICTGPQLAATQRSRILLLQNARHNLEYHLLLRQPALLLLSIALLWVFRNWCMFQ